MDFFLLQGTLGGKKGASFDPKLPFWLLRYSAGSLSNSKSARYIQLLKILMTMMTIHSECGSESAAVAGRLAEEESAGEPHSNARCLLT